MRMPGHISNEKGVALMLVLVMSVVVLAVMTSMIYLITVGTESSGKGKRYVTCLDAAIGSASVVKEYVDARGVISGAIGNGMSSQLVTETDFARSAGPTEDCQDAKIYKTTSDWPDGCYTSSLINTGDPDTYDVSFDVGNYRTFSKICNTIEGNSSNSGKARLALRANIRGVVYRRGSDIQVGGSPYEYNIELDTVNRQNNEERCGLSILYRY
jgi:hypothetical protein